MPSESDRLDAPVQPRNRGRILLGGLAGIALVAALTVGGIAVAQVDSPERLRTYDDIPSLGPFPDATPPTLPDGAPKGWETDDGAVRMGVAGSGEAVMVDKADFVAEVNRLHELNPPPEGTTYGYGILSDGSIGVVHICETRKVADENGPAGTMSCHMVDE